MATPLTNRPPAALAGKARGPKRAGARLGPAAKPKRRMGLVLLVLVLVLLLGVGGFALSPPGRQALAGIPLIGPLLRDASLAAGQVADPENLLPGNGLQDTGRSAVERAWEDLALRKAELDRREAELAAREEVLASRLQELAHLERAQAGASLRESFLAVYQAMSPGRAAAILQSLDDVDQVVAVLAGLEREHAALILSSMDAEYAAELLSLMMAGSP